MLLGWPHASPEELTESHDLRNVSPASVLTASLLWAFEALW